ncbi:MAG: hypothetical protein AAF636_18140 [Pseudomonadota bacterium]
MEQQKIGRAPNFTKACIVMFGVNLAWMLLAAFAIWGILGALCLCLLVNHWVAWIEHRRRTAEAECAQGGETQ